MVFLYIVEWTLIALLLMGFGSQIIWPALMGSEYFPFFRRHGLAEKRKEVVEEIAQTAEELEIQRLRKEAEELKSQLNTQNNNNNEEDHTKNDTI